MKRFILCLAALATFGLGQANAQYIKGSGKQVQEERSVSTFTKVSVQDGIDAYIRQGNAIDIKVKADQNIIDRIITKVEGNTLVVKMEKNTRYRGNLQQEVYITLTDLEALMSSGGSDVETEALNVEELIVKSSGGSDINLDVRAERLSLSSSGGSDLNVKGSAKMLEVSTSGGSDLNARGLKATDCKISTSGGSDATIYVTGKLSMTASGASDITYTGSPQIVSSRSSGAADISGN